MKSRLHESIALKGIQYNLVNDYTIGGVRHVCYRPDADNPSGDIVLTDDGHILETTNIRQDWDRLRKKVKNIKTHGRKLTRIEIQTLKKVKTVRLKKGKKIKGVKRGNNL